MPFEVFGDVRRRYRLADVVALNQLTTGESPSLSSVMNDLSILRMSTGSFFKLSKDE